MNKYMIDRLATTCGCVGLGVALIGFCGAIMSTVTTFTTMAGVGTAILSVALPFMKG